MKPIDIRDKNWVSIREMLTGRLEQVYQAWIVFGPATTREMANKSGIDILNVRPRTTDLVGVGLVECIGSTSGQGIYQALPQNQWEAWVDALRTAPQTQLHLI